MAELKASKVVNSLPDSLEANSIYFVRSGIGFDLYVTNNSGTVVAYSLNAAITKPDVQSVPDVAALAAAATGSSPKLIVCQSDPMYSDGPTLNLWDGTNLIVFAGQKRN